MHEPHNDPPELPALPAADPAPGWQPLPPRGALLAATAGGLTMAIALMIGSGIFALVLRGGQLPATLAASGLLGAAAGGWFAFRRHRRTFWQLDDHGLALRRGHWWQSETRVPISRVQHLDLRRGPLERAARLGTLVVHTAGSRFNAVSIAGLDQDDAERLRDRLARQLDHDDDAL
ncbi:PH domain-containing protein [Flavobacterium sp. MXW15]|uniref:PH domain-containing protein n=1 Tax=Xanthomonas chitinilytica TaxID=2989819 RepID=UPI002236BE8C|nr:PH domain-containing protein [Flavobacterium sp. MXW15]